MFYFPALMVILTSLPESSQRIRKFKCLVCSYSRPHTSTYLAFEHCFVPIQVPPGPELVFSRIGDTATRRNIPSGR
ncbi:hypothetical protein BJ912DRAFT_987260 [Pholiota molesta]|nr:hypothetical protein BJ912DRAFT_987260 [Pholiota molesta]